MGGKKTVSVFGLGFVGLTTALGFAETGCRVFGIDVDKERKRSLRNGTVPFHEPHMEGILNKHLNSSLFITDDILEAVKESTYIFYCVGTPYGADGSADLTYLFSAIDSTLDAIHDEKFRVLVAKSTIPPSTTAEKILPYVKWKGDKSKFLGIANNPEFLREGHCWEDFMEADRIVLGVNDEKSQELLVELYQPMGIPIKCVTHSTGEFIKYLSNTLLATLISYSNEMAQAAETFGGIEVAEAFRILHMDKRWNGCNMTSYVYPGCGYGGYCLPKDTSAFYAQALEKGFEASILNQVIKTNTERPKRIAEKIARHLTDLPRQSNSGKTECGQIYGTVGILGLSFKPGSDDVRDTPAMKIIGQLKKLGCENIIGYDPIAAEEFRRRYPDAGICYADSMQEIYDKADILAIVTAWEEFRDVPTLGDKKIIDCRYML
ncbi:UDP-glucose/GDP-mannose dehydrogenase family protein [Lachnospiraceae bacterium]|nr:UDP-glucose/GDP-mannose dehydrogenase family protein [Lachnospiraceae bacterium]